MAVNQVRRRKRPIPSVPPESNFPRPEKRYYCPACGMVRPDHAVRRIDGKDIARAHYVYVPGPWADRIHEYQSGESLSRSTCPGGEIDLVKDRAP